MSLFSRLPKWSYALGLRKGIDFHAPEYGGNVETAKRFDEAQVIISKIELPKETGKHKPVLDIDFPAELIASSTPGHFHLYLDKELDWPTYKALLRALADAGIIERGYYYASVERGYTAARLPWVRKEDAPTDSAEEESPRPARGDSPGLVIIDETLPPEQPVPTQRPWVESVMVVTYDEETQRIHVDQDGVSEGLTMDLDVFYRTLLAGEAGEGFPRYWPWTNDARPEFVRRCQRAAPRLDRVRARRQAAAERRDSLAAAGSPTTVTYNPARAWTPAAPAINAETVAAWERAMRDAENTSREFGARMQDIASASRDAWTSTLTNRTL
jgi:hypothetical protein